MVGALGIGAATYVTLDKAVVLSVDGKARQIHSFGSTVGDVLAAEKVPVGPRDLVAPGRSAKIGDGTRIAVRYARPLTLTVDGQKRTHWVTALNVGEAFNDLHVRYEGARTSASRSVGIARKGLAVDVRTLKSLTISHDGTRTPVSAPVLTVGEALARADVKVDADDRVRPALSSMVRSGSTIMINRVSRRTTSANLSLPYTTIHKTSSSMYDDQSKVERAGQRGVKRQVVEAVYIDGKKVSARIVSQNVVREPVSRVVVVGTKDRPKEDTSSGGGGGGGGGGGDGGGGGGGGPVGGGVDSLNWSALAQCESGGNPRAVNSAGYYGLYQFSVSTWHSVGGSGNPIDNSAGEQTYRAKLLYKKAGAGQWPVCGRKLFS